MEHWLPIRGYEDSYEVSSHGRVRSLARRVRRGESWLTVKGRVLQSRRGEYARVNLKRGGKGTTRLVHQLVLEAFVGPRPPGTECCHHDGDPRNNALENLRWDTRAGNMADARQHGTTGRKLDVGKVKAMRKLGEQGISGEEIGRRFQVSGTTARAVIEHRTWKHL